MKNIKMFSGVSMAFLLMSPVALFAETSVSTITATVAPVYNAQCASDAVVKHEDAIVAIRDVNQASMKTISTTRRDALKSAYLLTDEQARNTAIKNAFKASMDSEQTTMKTMQSAMKAENDTFMTTMKGCGALGNGINQIKKEYREDDEDKSYKDDDMIMGKPEFKMQKGDNTMWMQKMLMDKGHFSGKVDGKFGPMTKKALKEFQGKHNLKADGKLGPKTLEILKSFEDTSGDNY